MVTTISQNETEIDGGDDFDTATPILVGDYKGYLESPDANDYYKIYVNTGYSINVSMTPPYGSDFDLYLYYTPDVDYPIDSSTESGDVIENIFYTVRNSGYYFIRIFASAGLGSYTLNISIVDIDNPVVWITSPISDSYVKITTNITGTSYDFASGIQKVDVRIDDEPWQPATGTTSWYYLWNTRGFILGSSHTITARATDNENNSNTRSIDVIIDNIAPTILIISPTNGSKLESSSVDVVWIGSDAVSGIDHYEIKLNADTWIIKGITNHNFTGVGDGSHILHVKAIDKAGNTKEVAVNFIVNTSLILEPGWIDDIIILGGITAIAALVVYLVVKKLTPPPLVQLTQVI